MCGSVPHNRIVQNVRKMLCCLLFPLSHHRDMFFFGGGGSLYLGSSGYPPEKEFLEKISAIPGVSQVETQTITNMVI
jgi:hypothetical protein